MITLLACAGAFFKEASQTIIIPPVKPLPHLLIIVLQGLAYNGKSVQAPLWQNFFEDL
jgi:hypothetical protein